MTKSVRNASFLIALMLVAANLRPALTGVGPLLKTIQADLGLSATAAGLLGSVPLLMFAAMAPLARLARRFGTERLLLVALVLLIAGTLLRSEGHATTLFAGMVVLATGVAVANVLLPILIRQHYADRVPTITTAYATLMGGVAALASGVAVPLADVLPGGWRTSLASWALLAMLAACVWLPHLRPAEPAAASPVIPPLPLWRTAIAWQVTGFMGLQATVFYVSVSWYPSILHDAGYSPVSAGWLLTVYQLAAIAVGLLVPSLVRRFRDQRGLALASGLISALGTLGLLFAPGAALAWMLLLGIGAGPGLILALTFMGLRAGSPRSAAALSLMAQSLGYLLAALGPVAFGFVHDATGGWMAAQLCLVCLAVLQGFCGLGAGRAVRI